MAYFPSQQQYGMVPTGTGYNGYNNMGYGNLSNNNFAPSYNGSYGNSMQQGYQQPNMQMGPDPGGIRWVKGRRGADEYDLQRDSNVILMDNERSVFYIKCVDKFGKPEVHTFTFQEIFESEASNMDGQAGISKEDFQQLKGQIEELKMELKALCQPKQEQKKSSLILEGEGR